MIHCSFPSLTGIHRRLYGGHWRWNGARQKRPMSSIVLEPGVKDMILADCKDFLRSEDWYVSRSLFSGMCNQLTCNFSGMPSEVC